MNFFVTILGSNSAFPAYGRYPSAQVVHFNNALFLIDCGEGTQIQMSKYRIRRNRINHIFISHLHGDHVFGLPGLLTSFTQLSREAPIHIYGPEGIRELTETILRLSHSRINYDIEYSEFAHQGLVPAYEDQAVRVMAFPLRHRVQTYGYLFAEKPRPFNVRKEMISRYGLTTEQILDLKSGNDIVLDGRELPFEDMTLPRDPLRSYAYCSDTAYHDAIVPYIRRVQVLYHETTFMDALAELAEYSKHSTAKQAARIAQMAEAGALITGHYSSRYRDVGPLLEEARSIFRPTYPGLEGNAYHIGTSGLERVEEPIRN